MGSYGIGPARIAAAAVEQYADEQGISWPRAIAPWDVELVGARQAGHARARGRRGALRRAARRGPRVLFDDRDAGPGEKFADAELLGVPAAADGRASARSSPGAPEAQARRGRADLDGGVPLQGAAEAVRELWASLP